MRQRHPCGYCGKEFYIDANAKATRLKRSKLGLLFCDYECAAKFREKTRKEPKDDDGKRPAE